MSTTLAAPPVVASPASTTRIASIDLIRGAVMIMMAIDHVRVYSGLPAGGPSPGIFFTRWITHFCAPAFIFLAGTSIFFYARKHTNVPRFLLIRGVWLIFLELTVLRLAWTFNFEFAYEMAGVLWVIGWSMILMAGLVRLPISVSAVVGVTIIAGHNLLIDSRFFEVVEGLNNSPLSGLWKILYVGFYAGPVRFGSNGPYLIVLYSLMPWIGVMAAGYAFGRILLLEPRLRTRACLAIGLGAIAFFLVLRGLNLYGDPFPWHAATAQRPMPSLLSFLACTKYPASLDFLLMTLGPTIAVIPLLEHAHGPLAHAITTFGRVPFFFYVLHIPLIHALALIVSKIRLGFVSPWLFTNHPMGNPPPPDGYVWSLGLLYLVWAVAIVILYFVCRWFADLKSRRQEWWLSYL